MKKLLVALVLLVFAFLGLWTAQDNAQSITVTLLGFPVAGLSLGLWLILAFVAGVGAALLATLPLVWRLAATQRKLQAAAAQAPSSTSPSAP